MISFSKCTAEQYAGLTPVTDRIYYITDTGEIYLNGVKYGSGEITQIQADWDQSDSTAADYIKDKPALAPVATLGTYNSLSGKPAIPNFTGGWFGIWHDQMDNTATTVTLSVSGTNARANAFQYCTNINTNNWADYTLGTALTLTQYQYVLWRNKDSAKLLGNATGHYVFTITGGGVYLSGNIMSLKDKGMQYNDFCSAYDFYQMFKDCVTIKDASMLELPAAVGQYFSYAEMFKGCTGLVHAPRRICISNHVGNSGCQAMFYGCTSLVDAPEIECATLSANYTYAKMFYGCTSLKSAPPVLPARVMHGYDYDAMFGECTSLEEAPVIMATTMAAGCLRDMFYKCTSLKTVEMACPSLGANVSPGWLSNDIQAGLLKCPSSVDLSTRGADTVQEAWTVVRTDQPHADWNESDPTEAGYIRNKPTIPAAQVAVDWTLTQNSYNGVRNRYVTYKYGQVASDSTFNIPLATNNTYVLNCTGDVTVTAATLNAAYLAYNEIVLDMQAGATVAAGTNLTLVDTPEAGMRNVCVVRWQDGNARLYVVDRIPLDESSSI